MLYKSCHQIPVYTQCEYKVENKNIIRVKNTVMVLDDWDSMQNNLNGQVPGTSNQPGKTK